MEHRPLFFIFFLFVGIIISFSPRFFSSETHKKFHVVVKFLTCCCVFIFYYFATRGTHDLRVYQDDLDAISKLPINQISETLSYEIFSLISLWLFRFFDHGAYAWHASIVVFLYLGIVFFVESVIGKNRLILGVSFIAILPALSGEFILNQSRQLLATALLVLCVSFLVRHIKKTNVNRAASFEKVLLICTTLVILAFLSHYSSSLVGVIIPLAILILYFSKSKTFLEIFLKTAILSFLVGVLVYFSSSLASAFISDSSLEFATKKYSYYQDIQQQTFSFIIESKNFTVIQCLFFADFARMIQSLRRKNEKEIFAVKTRFSFYLFGFIIYFFCLSAIYTPGIMELGRRLLSYGTTAQLLSISVSLSMFKRLTPVMILTLPFTVYTIIMIVQEQDLASDHFFFAY